MDAFSEVLSGVRLQGAVFFNAEFSAPWTLATPPAQSLTPTLAPGAPHLVMYHYVVSGTAHATLRDGQRVDLGPGDIVVLPHGDAHHLGNGERSRPLDGTRLLEKIAARDLTPMRAGGGGECTRLICGFMSCDPQLCAPILDGLPPLLKVNVRSDHAGQWLESSLLHLVEEAAAARAGTEAMLAKVSEALFVDTLRRYVAELPESQTGWLAGARDPLVGRSLALLHGRVAHRWTLAELADAVGASRTVLVEHFSRYLGEPPIAYLTRWRLQLAARALRSTSRSVASVAADVGYESEAAFNRAFKRAFGLPPARYRSESRATAQEPGASAASS